MKQVVSSENLAPGIKLAEKVCDASGMVLLPEGSELDERLISILRKKKITDVTIIVERTPEELAAYSAELKAYLDGRFHCVAGNPLMDSLKNMIFEYHLGKQ